MHDLPPDLPRLRTLETWLSHTLARVQAAITEAERQEALKQRGEQARPPAPDWLIEQSLNGGQPVYIHAGDCHMAGKRSRPATRDQALHALTAGVDACTHCRPDTALGWID